MTDRMTALATRGAVRRLGWLFMIALPIVLAACGKGGTSGY